MKKCYTCQQMLDKSEFNKNKCRKDGLNSICRECSKARSKQYYKENPTKHKQEVAKRKKIVIVFNRKFVNRIKSRGCRICNEKAWQCMDFHHILGKKKNDISSIIKRGHSTRTLKNELRKCVCVCSNCHRKLHAGLIKLEPLGVEPK